MGLTRSRPSHEILSGDSADVYFARAETILEQEGLDPLVTMEVFTRQDAVLCGIDEARNLLGHVLAGADPAETRLEALARRRRHRAEGDRAPDPRPLPPVRAVRDGLPRDARPVDRLGHGRPRPCVEARRRIRSSASGRATSTPTSPTSSTTRRSSAAASAPRRRPARGWPAWPRPGRCPIRWS